MAKITKKQRQECEAIILNGFKLADRDGHNVEVYKKKFAKMTDDQFYDFCALDFPYRFHVDGFPNTKIEDIEAALNAIGQHLIEPIALPYLYRNKDGVPVNTKPCIVGYIPIKRVQQIVTKKNGMSVDISQRDMKTGRLTGHDKNGMTSDLEQISLGVMGLEKTMIELSRPRADSMNAKSQFYNNINLKGQVSLDDIEIEIDDSLSKNLMNTYLLGALLNSNLINQDYYLMYTRKEKQKNKGITRL